MGTLILVRHGQASFLAADYDRLSAIGEEQSRRLGEAWVERGVRLDAVYAGPRQRQQRTAEIVGDVYRRAGLPFPEPVGLEALDEMQVQLLLQGSVPELLAQNPSVRALLDKFQDAPAGPDTKKQFQKMFEAVMEMWVGGGIDAPGIESWAAFRERVRGALATMSDGGGGGRRVAAFTSGGPIAVAMQRALAAPDTAVIRLTFTIRNASVSEFLFNRERWSLSLFNEVSHLCDPRLLTYR